MFFYTHQWNFVSAGIIYPSYGISGFYPLPVQAFFIWDNKEITQRILLCLFLCKSRFFRFYECNRSNCFKFDTTRSVFLYIDDTIVTKFGKTFENISKLFDHAAHNGSNYLNGHCFVSLMLCVPLWNKNTIHYLSIPFGYCMWQKRNPNWNWLHLWCVRLCRHWVKWRMSSFFVTAGM